MFSAKEEGSISGSLQPCKEIIQSIDDRTHSKRIQEKIQESIQRMREKMQRMQEKMQRMQEEMQRRQRLWEIYEGFDPRASTLYMGTTFKVRH